LSSDIYLLLLLFELFASAKLLDIEARSLAHEFLMGGAPLRDDLVATAIHPAAFRCSGVAVLATVFGMARAVFLNR
jgi:hypothetical protein